MGKEVGTKNVGNKQEDFMTGKAGRMYAHNWCKGISAGMRGAQGGLSIQGDRE